MDHLQVENTAALGALLKSVRDIMRKDKGLNGDLDRLQSQRSAAGRGRLSLQGD